ncbi:MAG: hypothetical protein U0L05_01615 [Schaedlerella sp.]|nr:hypothetical protein [Schaedlerella sp.]
MGSKTKIIVLHMKEIIYTGIFILLGILLIILLIFMFHSGNASPSDNSSRKYIPGTYTSTLTLNNTALEVEVSVDETQIQSIRFSNLEESVTTAYPLIQPAIEEIADQIYETQSLDEITLSSEMPYTSQLILEAVYTAVEKAAVD